MKYRKGFVTNSSSSSYIVTFKVEYNNLNRFIAQYKEKFGSVGLSEIFSRINTEKDGLVFEDRYSEYSDKIRENIDTDLYKEDYEEN